MYHFKQEGYAGINALRKSVNKFTSVSDMNRVPQKGI